LLSGEASRVVGVLSASKVSIILLFHGYKRTGHKKMGHKKTPSVFLPMAFFKILKLIFRGLGPRMDGIPQRAKDGSVVT